jgi:isopenicillin-N N-acyltransferase-like protein
MTAAHPTVPTLDLSGTPAQIGAAHGEALRPKVREHAERFVEILLQTSAQRLSEEQLWSQWAGQVAANEREAPHLVEEMHGIARGAGVPFERVFLLNSLLDINSLRYFDLAAAFAGCSTFAVTAAADTGQALVGQTYDMSAYHQDYLALLRLRPVRGPRQLVFTFAGIVGAAGLNEAGIALNINYLSPTDVGLGRLHAVIVRQVLAAANFADAVAPAMIPPRAGGAHFLVAEADGTTVSIETTARRFRVFHPVGNAIGHTNHYLDEGLKELEYIRPTSIGSSVARHAALSRFLRDRGATLTVEALKELTRNHTAYPRSICAHGCEADPAPLRSRTVAALVQVPADRVMHLCPGCACENEYHAVRL